MDNDIPMTRREASDYLGSLGFAVAVNTLAKYATVGGGPPYVRFGKRVLYQRADLVTWAHARLSGPKVAA